jgi:hypothetical protein
LKTRELGGYMPQISEKKWFTGKYFITRELPAHAWRAARPSTFRIARMRGQSPHPAQEFICCGMSELA